MRYIDADKIPYTDLSEGRGVCWVTFMDWIKKMPTADVVEVVRCKDCKNRIFDKSRNLFYCQMYYGMGNVSDNNYCSYGERADK